MTELGPNERDNIFKWEENKQIPAIKEIIDNERINSTSRYDNDNSALYVPKWFQTLMDDKSYAVHKLCGTCGTRIVGYEEDCECAGEVGENWVCTLCNIGLGNDIRDDYFHMVVSHPEYLIIGRLANA